MAWDCAAVFLLPSLDDTPGMHCFSFATICVFTFGFVSSGSVTAFLLEKYKNDKEIVFWLNVANATVSLSVLLTYPLQLFPALELLAPKMSSWFSGMFGSKRGGGADDDVADDDDLSAFEPLPPLPEHGYPSLDDLPPNMEHNYEPDSDDAADDDSWNPTKSEDGDDSDKNDINDNDNDDELSLPRSAVSSIRSIMPQLQMPGDSLQLRAALVTMTYLIAVVVPNVQSLISLAGALAGSSTALLIPPMLELAWIRALEEEYNGAAAGAQVATTNPKKMDRAHRIFLNTAGTSWFVEKIKCYVLFILGVIFMCIGTYASLADIVRIYLGDDEGAAAGSGDAARRELYIALAFT